MTDAEVPRWIQRLHSFERAHAQLGAGCAQGHYSELERAGLIQFFEYTFGLGWKTLKDLLNHEGYEVATPRETIRRAVEIGFIEHGDIWLEALESRNRFSHTYNEALAREAVALIRERYAPRLASLLAMLQTRAAAA